MNRNEIKSVIETLAKSQGFYGRVLASINELKEDKRETFWSEMEKQGFKNCVDVVMFFEC